MLAYDSNPMNPHPCGASQGGARGTVPSRGAGRSSIWHMGAVRAQRA
jgi:hypothetical protein